MRPYSEAIMRTYLIDLLGEEGYKEYVKRENIQLVISWLLVMFTLIGIMFLISLQTNKGVTP